MSIHLKLDPYLQYSVKRKEGLVTKMCFVFLTLEENTEGNAILSKQDILIRYLDVELLFGLAESRTVKFSGHFNQVVAAEQEISFTSCS